MGKTEKLSALVLIVVVGFTIAAAYHYVQGVYLGEPYPRNTFLFDPRVFGSDFKDVVRDGHNLNPYLQFSSAQYPLLAVVGFLFSLMPRFGYGTFMIVMSIAFLALVLVYVRTSDWVVSLTSAFVLTFLSYPFLFDIDRGNFEILVAIFLLAFFLFIARKRYLIGAVMLSFAIALKLLPIIFLVIFLPRRKFRELAISATCAAGLTLGSLLLFHGGPAANMAFLLHGSNITANPLFAQFTSLSSAVVQRGVSLFTFLKIVSHETGLMQGFNPEYFLWFYMILAATLGGLLVVYVVILEKELWRQASLLTFAALLLPQISADYRLLHLFAPVLLFVNAESRSRLDGLYTVIFGLLLIPKDYAYFNAVVSDATFAHDVSIAIPVNILMMVIMTLILVVAGPVQQAHAGRRDAPVSGKIVP